MNIMEKYREQANMKKKIGGFSSKFNIGIWIQTCQQHIS